MRSASHDPNTRTVIDPEDRRPETPETPDTPDTPDVPGMRFPGAEDDLPERLGRRIQEGPAAGGIASGESDLLPDVEIPDTSM